jgi:spermidine synthase
MSMYAGLFLLSVATLAFEINLTRIFSVAQFYHFAFMIVSLALLGFGASGTYLTIRRRSGSETKPPALARTLERLSWAFAITTIGSYALTLYVPFDSFRIAHNWRQGGVLALHYVALAIPFFCSGAAVGLLIETKPQKANCIYAANLIGSALGCVLAIAAPSLVGGEGVILLAAAIALLSTLAFQSDSTFRGSEIARSTDFPAKAFTLALCVLLVMAAWRTPSFLEVHLSPYKSLSQILLYPDAELIFQRWNSFSRVDVVRSASIRGLPGSSFRCDEQPPPQLGLTVDGDDLTPISHVNAGFDELSFTDCLLTALPYRLRPQASTLVLEPRGGLDVLTALAEGAASVTAVEPNPLIVQAVRQQGAWAGNLYEDPRVRVVVEKGRTYARRSQSQYDVLALALNTPQQTVTSGAYSLNEDYRYTVQAFSDYLARLDDDGLLVVPRWLQMPPSESVRAFAMTIEALEKAGSDPERNLVALRSYRQMLILARRSPFTKEELSAIRDFAEPRAFDLVYLPDIHPDEVNRQNVLSEPLYHQAYMELLKAEDRQAWYQRQRFNVEPPTDDQPFFGHFFKWEQAPEVVARAGHTWQPFGGAGYFVLLILLALAVTAAAGVILIPLAKVSQQSKGPLGTVLIYFASLGLGYLCVEIPLLQRFILFLGHPAYAMATVLFAILLFSGLGSMTSKHMDLRLVLLLLPALVGAYTLGLPKLFEIALGLPIWGRLIVAVVTLAPGGLLMGMPFPKGMALLEHRAPGLITWAWGINGAVSVVASVMAALLALSFGFSTVLVIGAACYLSAWIAAAYLRG